MKFIEKSSSNAVVGYMFFSGIFSVMFALAFEDAMYLAFGIFILMALGLGASIDSGDVKQDIAYIGWSSTNIYTAIPLGVLGGIIVLVLGSFIISIDLMNVLIPDMTSFSKFLTKASVISPLLAVSANIIAQVLVIAPSEESLKLILAPYAAKSIYKNVFAAFGIGIILWISMHVPTFVMRNVTNNMYLVLLLLGVVTTILFIMTNNILSPIITHITFNISVILSSASSDVLGTLTVIGIVMILLVVWLKNQKTTKSRSRI